MSSNYAQQSSSIFGEEKGNNISYPFYLKLATVVEGDPKALFSIATTPRYTGEHNSFPWIAPLYTWSVPYNAEC